MSRRGKGEGSISQRKKDGLWIGQVTLGIDPRSCKQIRRTVCAKTRKECADKVNKLITDRDSGSLVKTDKLTVEQWLTQWLENYKKVNIKQTTYDSYNLTIKKHLVPQIGSCQLQKLTTNMVQKLIKDMIAKDFSARTIEYAVYVLSSAIIHAKKLQLVKSNPCDNVELPKKQNRRITTFEVDELMKFKQTMKDYYLSPAFLLQMTTGIRRGECLGLTWECVNLDEKYISIRHHLVRTTQGVFLETPKTQNSIRDIPLTCEMVEVLRKLKGNKKKGLVFTTNNGNYIDPRSYQRSFDMMLEKAGLIVAGQPKPRIHDLRHTFATQLIANNVDLSTTSLLLGHSNTKFTANVYVHPSMDMKRKAMEKMSEIMSQG